MCVSSELCNSLSLSLSLSALSNLEIGYYNANSMMPSERSYQRTIAFALEPRPEHTETWRFRRQQDKNFSVTLRRTLIRRAGLPNGARRKCAHKATIWLRVYLFAGELAFRVQRSG